MAADHQVIGLNRNLAISSKLQQFGKQMFAERTFILIYCRIRYIRGGWNFTQQCLQWRFRHAAIIWRRATTSDKLLYLGIFFVVSFYLGCEDGAVKLKF